MKSCGHCRTAKGAAEFRPDPNQPDGLRNWCNECNRAYDRARNSNPARREKRIARMRKYLESNPKVAKAKNLLQSAVRYGKIERLPCLICGEKAEAHHPDYDQPLSVVWLCKPHHLQLHKEHERYAPKGPA